jgi:hypothetical protein
LICTDFSYAVRAPTTSPAARSPSPRLSQTFHDAGKSSALARNTLTASGTRFCCWRKKYPRPLISRSRK